MNDNRLQDLLERFDKGLCEEFEEQLLIDYFDSLQNDDQWNESLFGKKSEIEAKIYSRIKLSAESPRRNKIKDNGWPKIAAAILIIIGSVFIFQFVKNQISINDEQIELLIKTTVAGQKNTIKLSDGTTIILNSESVLKIPREFKGTKREVELVGEAYFNVATNPEKPFIVKSGKVSTQVYGTIFNVKAFPEDEEIKVSLLEGVIKVEIDEGQKPVFDVAPDQQLVFNKKNLETKLEDFAENSVVGWKDNILIFKNETLRSVLKTISRAYGVEVSIKNDEESLKKITAEFKNTPLKNVAELLKFTTGLQYDIKTDKEEIKRIEFYK